MFALAYLSHATAPFDDEAIAALSEKSQVKNERLDLTGYLNYHPRRCAFFQFLEGSREDVRDLMDEIMDDRRHQVVNLILLGESKVRFFPRWSMRRLDTEYFRAIEMEDVLENVVTVMSDKTFDRDSIASLVMRLAMGIAAARRIN